jgi:hypothetical protein
MFKTRNASLKLHPLTKRLVQFKQMLDQVGPLDDIVMPQIQEVLEMGDTIVRQNDISNDKNSHPVKR